MAIKNKSTEIKAEAEESTIKICSPIKWEADGSRALIGKVGGRTAAAIKMTSYAPMAGSFITEIEPEFEVTMLLANPSPWVRVSEGGVDAAKKAAQDWVEDYVTKFISPELLAKLKA